VPATVAALRAYGARRVTLVTCDGEFDGHIVAERLSDDAVMLMFAPADAPDEPLVVALAAIEEIVER